jgi:hypothetical protein
LVFTAVKPLNNAVLTAFYQVKALKFNICFRRLALPGSEISFCRSDNKLTLHHNATPMWRNGRRNGLKIAVLAISKLRAADQNLRDLAR